MGERLRNSTRDRDEQVAAKVAAIRAAIEETRATTYAETSNAFVKGWPGLLVHELGWPTDVIVLRRNLGDQIGSFLRLGFFSFSGHETAWMDWMPLAGLEGTASSMPNGVPGDQVDRIIAYLVDVEARTARLESTLDADFHPVTLESITTSRGVVELFDALDLQPSAAVADVIGVPLNTRAGGSVTELSSAEVKRRLGDYESALVGEGRHKELSHLRTLMQ